MKTFVEWNNILKDSKKWPIGCFANEWGSCQYYTAKSIYDLYFHIKEDLMVEYPTSSNFELRIYLMSLFSINYDTAIEIPSFIEVKEKAKDFFQTVDSDSSSVDTGRIEYLCNIINDITTFDELFVLFRNLSYDLWTTAPIIFNWVLTGITFDKVQNSPGTGPVMNVEAQSVNYKVGLMCAILKDCDLIMNEESFTSFDT